MSNSKIAKNVSKIMIITIIGKLVGFLREAIVASEYGANYQTDAYTIAYIIPFIVFSIISVAISTTFIPILNEVNVNEGENKMFEFASNIINILFVLSLILCIIGMVFSPVIVNIIAPSYEGEVYILAVKLTRISMINIIFLSLNSGFMAILQTKEEFTSPALTGLMISIPVLLYIWFGIDYGVTGLTYATTFGYLLQVLIQVPWIIKIKYKHYFIISFKDPRIKKMLLLILPVIIGECINQINVLVDKMMATGLEEGSIVSLNLAAKVNNLIYMLFSTAIVTVIYPILSREAAKGKLKDFVSYINKSMKSILLILIPVTFFIIIYNKSIVSILFEHGKFDSNGVKMTSIALFYYNIGVVFYGIRDVYNKAFFAMKDTRTPMINGIISVVLNIILNLTLIDYMGIGALPLASSISSAVTTLLLYVSLKKRVKLYSIKDVLPTVYKSIVASGIFSIILYFVNNITQNLQTCFFAQVLLVLVGGLIAGVIYIISLLLLKEKEITNLYDRLVKRFILKRQTD